MKNRQYKFLEEKLYELEENNIISKEQCVKAKEYFNYNAKPAKSMTTIFTSIGLFLIALSMITLFAFNWDIIAKEIKVVISFVPLVITAVMMFFCIKKDDEKIKLYTSIVAPISILANLSLIGQIFHMQLEIYEMFFIGLLMFIPIAFTLRNYLSILVYCIGTITYIFNVPDIYLDSLINIAMIILPVLIYNVINYRKEKNSKINILMWITNIIALTFVLFEGEIIREESAFIYGYLIYLMTKTLFNNKNILSRFLNIIIIISMFVFSCNGIAIECELGLDTLIIALIAATFIYIGKFYKDIKEYFIFAFICLIQFFAIPDEISYILVNILIITLGIYKIMIGNKMNIYKEIKQGIAIILTLIMFRFMRSDLDFITKSIIFMISGISFIVAANIMKKRIGGKKDDEVRK